MSVKLNEVIANSDAEAGLAKIINNIHQKGPIQLLEFEQLAYIKKFQPQLFSRYERKITSVLGLFYKTVEPQSLLEEIYNIFSDGIEDETGRKLTPVQADAFNKIGNNTYFSFSAPTSAGKSFLFRELLLSTMGDILIIVPSRALIAEYFIKVNEIMDKSVLVSQFIEHINIKHTSKRVFIITPERGVDLFKNIANFNIELILLDEAQISEEGIRGMRFDSLVRRIDKFIPKAKKVFTHPFVLNPEAQLSKHNFSDHSDSYCYKQNSVGKIYQFIKDDVLTYFSPFETDNKFQIVAEENIIEKTLAQNGTVLIYVSKNKIYDGRYLIDFERYIKLCEKITNPIATNIIEELRVYIGASNSDEEKHSLMIEIMERGIVIHHGSIPLKARLIIERFVNANYAKICFSTSTLIQGINMPFDVVWISNFKFAGSPIQKNLDLKNLIGRAGRSTNLQMYSILAM
jgi:replicative superfamily II helicase